MKERIKRLREAKGLTQTELARRLGFESTSIISMWESGARTPSTDKLPQLAQIFGCTIDELFERDTA